MGIILDLIAVSSSYNLIVIDNKNYHMNKSNHVKYKNNWHLNNNTVIMKEQYSDLHSVQLINEFFIGPLFLIALALIIHKFE
ncbi:hypothetical protein V1477_018084 [Vespula maculifrons]|uniref:Uncharacterized protein n=1 Tax=Vespula maculifrons TaxID=7453 RepID=A0ABD2B0N1_VESMC